MQKQVVGSHIKRPCLFIVLCVLMFVCFAFLKWAPVKHMAVGIQSYVPLGNGYTTAEPPHSDRQTEPNTVTLAQAIAAFYNKTTSETCKMAGNSSFCPSTLQDGTCSPAGLTKRQLSRYVVEDKPFVPLFADHQFVFQFERQLLSLPQLTDIREAPSLILSRLVPTGNSSMSEKGVVSCQVGDVVKVRADLVDGFGQARTLGFDDVRAWMVELVAAGNGRVKRGRSAGAEVVDLKNGSYEISFRCLWPNTTSKLNVGVPYPREYLRRVLWERRMGIYRLTAGHFQKGGTNETTPCFSTPNLAWPCLCNLTKWNNASFYCGRPRDARLSCSDLVGFSALATKENHVNATKAEILLMSQMARSPNASALRQDLFLRTGATGSLRTAQACRNTSRAVTWTAARPKGFFDQNRQWYTLLCKQRTFTPVEKMTCLRNTTVWIFGDSNAIRIKDVLGKSMGASCSSETSRIWATKIKCYNSKINFITLFNPHEYHLYLGQALSPVARLRGVPAILDSIPSSGRYIVIAHYYLHIIGAHFSVLHDRLLAFRGAVLRLLSRNPQAVVALRGPHTISTEWADNHSMGGDVQSMFYLPMLLEMFRDLQDKVILLDGWEMTSALENRNIHPDNKVPAAMVELLLNFVCD